MVTSNEVRTLRPPPSRLAPVHYDANSFCYAIDKTIYFSSSSSSSSAPSLSQQHHNRKPIVENEPITAIAACPGTGHFAYAKQLSNTITLLDLSKPGSQPVELHLRKLV